jgi:CheY-like chemotaxis protein
MQRGLIVDGEATSRRQLRFMVDSTGSYATEMASTGQEAIAMLRQKHYDFMLIEMNM